MFESESRRLLFRRVVAYSSELLGLFLLCFCVCCWFVVARRWVGAGRCKLLSPTRLFVYGEGGFVVGGCLRFGFVVV